MPKLLTFLRLLLVTLLVPWVLADWKAVSTAVPLYMTPGDSGSFFAADTGAVYVSSDSGQTWQTTTDTKVSPLASLTYTGGKIWAGSAASGVAYSSDGGSNWTTSIQGMIVPPLLTVAPTVFGVASLSNGTTLLATLEGIYLSSNGAQSWGPSSTGLPTTGVAPFVVVQPVYGVVVGPGGAVYAATTQGIYASTDSAVTWNVVGLAGKPVQKLVGSSAGLYALSYSDGVYYSPDGANWTKLSGLSEVPDALAVDPNNSQSVYAGTSTGNIWRSTDAGNTWTQVNTAGLPSSGINALAVSSSGGLTLLASTTVGIYRSSDVSSLPSVTGAPLSTLITSDPITLAGLLAPTPISIVGGSYSIAGGAFTSAPGTVVNGAQIRIQLTSSANYGTTTSATVTVGSHTYTFKVTTIVLTVVTSVTQVLQTADPTVSVDASGRLVVSATPSQPLQLRSDTPTNAVVLLPKNQPVPVQSGTHKLTFTDTTGSSQLLTQSVSGSAGLQVASGRIQVDSSATNDALPVSSNSSLQTQASATSLLVDKTGEQTRSFVKSGKVQFSSTGSASNGVSIYGGETAETSSSGSLAEISIGSLDGNQGLPGDPLTLSNLDSTTTVPQLNGTLQRLNGTGTLLTVVQAAFDKLYGATNSQISYDSTLGVVTYTAGGNTYRFIPLGQPTAQTTTSTSTRVLDNPQPPGGKPSGSFTIASQGINLTVATSLAYLGDLDKALKSVDAGSTIKLRSNGSIKVHFSGVDYLTIPGGTATGGGTAGIPSFTTDLSGYLAFVDSNSAVQVLYPVFSDIAVVDQTVKTFDTAGGATESGNGTVAMTLSGNQLTLFPDYNLSSVPGDHASDLFWVDGAKFYLRYQDGTAQGFTIK